MTLSVMKGESNTEERLGQRLNEDSPVPGDELQGDPRELPEDAQFPKGWHLSGMF